MTSCVNVSRKSRPAEVKVQESPTDHRGPSSFAAPNQAARETAATTRAAAAAITATRRREASQRATSPASDRATKFVSGSRTRSLLKQPRPRPSYGPLPGGRAPPAAQDDLHAVLRPKRDAGDPLPQVRQSRAPAEGERGPEGITGTHRRYQGSERRPDKLSFIPGPHLLILHQPSHIPSWEGGRNRYGAETEQRCARGNPFERTGENEGVSEGRLRLEVPGHAGDELLDVRGPERPGRGPAEGREFAGGRAGLHPLKGHRWHGQEDPVVGGIDRDAKNGDSRNGILRGLPRPDGDHVGPLRTAGCAAAGAGVSQKDHEARGPWWAEGIPPPVSLKGPPSIVRGAVDGDDRPRHVAGLIRAEEGSHLRNVLRRPVCSAGPGPLMANRFNGLPEREGRDVSRGDRVDRDSAPDLAFREDAGEAVPRDLPDRVVVRRLGELLRTLHPNVHDPSPTFPAHVRQRRPDRVEHAVDFRPQHALPVCICDLRKVFPWVPHPAGVVHEDVDGAELRFGPREHASYLRRFRGVGANDDRASAEVPDHVCESTVVRGAGRPVRSVVQDHGGTFSGQRERRASPHPLARTPGHHRDVAFQGPWHAAGNGVRSITLSGNVITKATRAMSGSASADRSPSRMDLPARSVGLAGRADFGG